jgi:hypothetical protein
MGHIFPIIWKKISTVCSTCICSRVRISQF